MTGTVHWPSFSWEDPLLLDSLLSDDERMIRDAVEADAAYRATATNWTWPVALVLEATPTLGYDEPVAVELALDRGAP